MQRADAVFHRVPLFLGGVNKWLFDREKIEHEMAEWLMGQADYGDVVVELDRARKVATAYVCGFGDEPFDAAKRALGKCRATDRRGKYMFCDVKPHDDYGWAVARRADEAADRLALEALAREAADRENAAPANAADRAPPAKQGRSPAASGASAASAARDARGGGGGGGATAGALRGGGGATAAGVDGDALAARVVDAAVAELEAAAAREDPPAALASGRRPRVGAAAKFSRHVVARVFRGDGAPAPLAGSRAAGVLAARVSAALGPRASSRPRAASPRRGRGVYTRAASASRAAASSARRPARPSRCPAARARAGPIPAAPGLRCTLVARRSSRPRARPRRASGPAAPPPPATAPARGAGAARAGGPRRRRGLGAGLARRGGDAARRLLDHPYITVSTRGAGRPPPPLDAVFDAALASLRGAAGGEPRASRWAYKAAAHPSERLLHVTLGGAVVCASKGRHHKSQKAIVTADPVSGACWQRCWDAADCSTVAANAAGGAVALANKRRLPDVPRADFKALLDYERDFHAGVVARRDAPAPPAPTPGRGT
ncbi:hypothetical protein JL722_11151 [Aureococcus anophagefferens]|nr:hypothetical protein JL722_11151 [Aureococcus anophagefferens]